MNNVQGKIAQLQEKDWTLAAIADELDVAHSTVEKWKAGDRQPCTEKLVLDALGRLMKKRPPKKKRYAKGNRRQEVTGDG